MTRPTLSDDLLLKELADEMNSLEGYKLVDRKPVLCTVDEARIFRRNRKENIIGRDNVGQYFISTVFSGFAYSTDSNGEPRLFSTVVFRGDESIDVEHYNSWDEAEAGHQRIVEEYKAKVN